MQCLHGFSLLHLTLRRRQFSQVHALRVPDCMIHCSIVHQPSTVTTCNTNIAVSSSVCVLWRQKLIRKPARPTLSVSLVSSNSPTKFCHDDSACDNQLYLLIVHHTLEANAVTHAKLASSVSVVGSISASTIDLPIRLSHRLCPRGDQRSRSYGLIVK